MPPSPLPLASQVPIQIPAGFFAGPLAKKKTQGRQSAQRSDVLG